MTTKHKLEMDVEELANRINILLADRALGNSAVIALVEARQNVVEALNLLRQRREREEKRADDYPIG